jgi:hypothetical protein
MAINHIDDAVLERRRHLVLHDFDLDGVADDIGTVLDRIGPTEINPDRGVEL